MRREPRSAWDTTFPPPDDPRYYREVGLDSNWLDEDDPLQHLIARMAYDEKTEKMTIKATLRFKTGKEGPALLEESAKASIEAMKAQKFYTLVKTYFDKIQWQHDGEDLHVSVVIKPNDLSGLCGAGGLATYLLMAAPVGGMAPAAPAPVLVERAVEVKKDAAKKNDAKKKPTSRPKGRKKNS